MKNKRLGALFVISGCILEIVYSIYNIGSGTNLSFSFEITPFVMEVIQSVLPHLVFVIMMVFGVVLLYKD